MSVCQKYRITFAVSKISTGTILLMSEIKIRFQKYQAFHVLCQQTRTLVRAENYQSPAWLNKRSLGMQR